MDDREDGGIGTDAERERQDHDGGKAGIADKSAQSISQILPEMFEEVEETGHNRLLDVRGLLRREGDSGSAKFRRNLLGVTRKRRVKARRKESAPLNPTDTATWSIEDSPPVRRRRASFSRSVSTNIAGDEPKCSLKRRKNCRGESEARRARVSTDISAFGLFVIQFTNSENRSFDCV